jgi:hypothetical protein
MASNSFQIVFSSVSQDFYRRKKIQFTKTRLNGKSLAQRRTKKYMKSKRFMKKKLIFIILIACWLTFGCSSQADREAFLEEYIRVADEIVRTVDANPTSEGVKQAQDYLDSKKNSLKSKFDAGKNSDNDAEMARKFSVIVAGQIRKIGDLSVKHQNLQNDLDNLTRDFGEFLLKN